MNSICQDFLHVVAFGVQVVTTKHLMQLYVQEKIGLGRFYQLSKRGWCKFGSSIHTELYGVLTKI